MRRLAALAVLLPSLALAQSTTPTFDNLTVLDSLNAPTALTTLGNGESRNRYGAFPTSLLEIKDGTAANPLDAGNMTVHISRTSNITNAATCNNNPLGNSECNTAVNVQVFGGATNLQLLSGINVYATATGGSGPPQALNAHADVQGTSNAWAEGAYIQGRRSSTAAHAIGAEIRVSNNTTSDCAKPDYLVDAWCVGIVVGADPGQQAPGNSASTAIQVVNPYAFPFKEGLTFNQASVTQTTFNDQTSATTSINIGGTHATAINSGSTAGEWVNGSGQMQLGLDTRANPVLLSLDTAAAQYRTIAFQTAGTSRWTLQVNNAAEAGGNAGAGFAINAMDDAGSLLSTPISISRATGVVTIPKATIDGATLGGTTPGAASVTQLNLTTSAGPNIRSGAGAASGTQPKGSIYIRTDGAVGTTIYVSQGAGVWNPIGGV